MLHLVQVNLVGLSELVDHLLFFSHHLRGCADHVHFLGLPEFESCVLSKDRSLLQVNSDGAFLLLHSRLAPLLGPVQVSAH